jgi:3-oxoadipate enol-lactonase
MTRRTVITDDGTRLCARVDGPPDGTPLLLCNSLGTEMSAWRAQVGTWAATRRVVRFDQRGHGDSDAPPGPYTVERLGRDACEVLDAFEIDRADVCGISLGGLVALWVAAETPQRVRRLVLADTAVRVGTEEAWRGRAELVRSDGMEAVTDLVLARFFSAAFRDSGDPEVGRIDATLRTASVDGYAASCEALAVGDLRGLAPRVRAPTLVIVGTADEATPPSDARELQRFVPDARLVEIDGAGHLANLERPERFTTLVERFLIEEDEVPPGT